MHMERQIISHTIIRDKERDSTMPTPRERMQAASITTKMDATLDHQQTRNSCLIIKEAKALYKRVMSFRIVIIITKLLRLHTRPLQAVLLECTSPTTMGSNRLI